MNPIPSKPTQSQILPPPLDAPGIKGGHWKDGLRDRLISTNHERSPDFEKLLEDYISDRDYPIGMLVHECIKHHEPILGEIFAHEGLKVLSLNGPITEKGWQTLRNAVGENSPLKVLILWNMEFDSTTGKQFLDIVGHLPALETLTLCRVGVKDTFYSDSYNSFETLEGQVSSLKALNVTGGEKGAPNAIPVVLKILEYSMLDHLSFVDAGGVSPKQHASLGEALMNQFDLKSLGLGNLSSEHFQFYMPFLCKGTPLRALTLQRCTLETSEWNGLLAGLSRSKRDLEKLSITSCWLEENDGLGIEMSHLASMRNLVKLDLSENSLDASTIVSLFELIEKEGMGLLHLHLSCNAVDKATIEALAKLVEGNKKLLGIEFETSRSLGDEILRPLAVAMERNTSLQKLFVQRTFGPCWSSLNASLERNRRSLAGSLTNGMNAGIHLTLRNLKLGRSFESYFIENAGFSGRDALALSSLNRNTWDERHRPILKDDPSK